MILKLGGDAGPQRFPELKGPFIGQDLPGKQPKVFAPDIVLPSHSSVTSTSDGKEFYWQSARQTIWATRWDEGGWTKPEAVPFSQAIEKQYRDDCPFVAPDGKKMFFISTRPVAGSEPGKENIWYVERISGGWGDPKPVSAAVNSLSLHWQVSVAASGTLYFAGTGPECYGYGDIYSSRHPRRGARRTSVSAVFAIGGCFRYNRRQPVLVDRKAAPWIFRKKSAGRV